MSHILPMYEYIHGFHNVLFVVDAPAPASVANCCFPQFLSYEYEVSSCPALCGVCAAHHQILLYFNVARSVCVGAHLRART